MAYKTKRQQVRFQRPRYHLCVDCGRPTDIPEQLVTMAPTCYSCKQKPHIQMAIVEKPLKQIDIAEMVFSALEFYAGRTDGGKARDVLERLYRRK